MDLSKHAEMWRRASQKRSALDNWYSSLGNHLRLVDVKVFNTKILLVCEQEYPPSGCYKDRKTFYVHIYLGSEEMRMLERAIAEAMVSNIKE